MNIESVSPAGPPVTAPIVDTQRQTPRPAPTQNLQKPQQADKPLLSAREQSPAEPSKQNVEEAVKRLNSFVANSQSEINFSIDEESGIRVVKVIDSQSKEVIRQFPSEEAIELARALDKLQGLLIKDKA